MSHTLETFHSYLPHIQGINQDTAATELGEEVLDLPKEAPADVDSALSDHCLIVYNDDHNTFEHVIETLIRVCKHDRIQAEQCTYIVHYKGKCCVKKGTYPRLKPMQESIGKAGIQADII